MRRRAQNGRFDAGSGARGPGWVRPMASAPEVSQDSAVCSSSSSDGSVLCVALFGGRSAADGA